MIKLLNAMFTACKGQKTHFLFMRLKTIWWWPYQGGRSTMQENLMNTQYSLCFAVRTLQCDFINTTGRWHLKNTIMNITLGRLWEDAAASWAALGYRFWHYHAANMLVIQNIPRLVQGLCLAYAAPYNEHPVLSPHSTAAAVVSQLKFQVH